MIYEKKKKRSRVVILEDGDFYETMSGVKVPIKQKPLIFFDLQAEITQKSIKLLDYEKKRKENEDEFDYEEYTRFLLQYYADFYNLIITVINFNGWEVDEEFIKSNFSPDDLQWFIRSVASGVPIYSLEDIEAFEKKTKK